ncbi:hypothetical protein [Brevibacterium atlanticum]|uniref:hypothetical protein n=1 Tax=Brevibacterium atlanticum TaxID=2697563 RepID=UPI001422F4B3|nr:hypothetical protein [Brevibacterium atlanticum]
MTSTDFTYPQPTDDELAAQQPRHPAPNAPLIYSSPGAGLDHYEQAPHPANIPAPGAVSAASGGTSADGFVHGARPRSAGPDPADATNSPALGRTAMVLSLVAGVLSVVASVILGATVGPSEAASGYYFTDTPDWYQSLAAALVGLQALCTGLGVTAVILGIVAAVTARGRTFGIIAISAAVIAPFVSFGTFIALSFAFA